MTTFWDNLPSPPYANEAEVEQRFVFPFLSALGYENDEIAPKYPVIFQEGRKGRRPETDFAVFHGAGRSLNESLIAVEAKAPGESFQNAKAQAESYAQNLRTPFFIVTDGESIEVWQLQPSSDSQQLISCDVSNIHQHRGQIEAVLSKEPARAFKRSLRRPDALEQALDVNPFVAAEHARLSHAPNTIPRTLKASASQTTSVLQSDDILRHYPQGALITGPSGFGKTSLATRFLSKSLERFAAGAETRIPLSVYLPDVTSSGETLETYVQQRLAHHCPSIVPSTFRHLLRSSGAIFLCDGFERVPIAQRASIEAQFRSLARDFPKVALFLFSRPSANPETTLESLKLEGLNLEEQQAVLNTTMAEDAAHSFFRSLSATLRNLIFHPLLLSRILEHWNIRGALPTQLNELFEVWIEQLLQNMSPSDKVDVRTALTIVAGRTSESPLTTTVLLSELRRLSISTATFDLLLSGDGVLTEGHVVEVQHEALADYLRASEAMTSAVKLEELLSAQSFKSDSLLPVILVSLTRNRAARNTIWEKLTAGPIQTYFESLRFRANLAPVTTELDEELEFNYLEDIRDGITQPLRSYFPALEKTVTAKLCGRPADEMSIVGGLSNTGVYFHFVSDAKDRVILAKRSESTGERNGPSFGVNLVLSQLRLDSGRLIGGQRLYEALVESITSGTLSGGTAFRTERLLSRLQYLHVKHWKSPLRAWSLESLRQELAPHSGEIVRGDIFQPTTFSIDELLGDIDHLLAQGERLISPWWQVEIDASNQDRLMTAVEESEVLQQHFFRAQRVYAEVCRETFSKVADDFGMFRALPAQWAVTLVRRNDSHRYMHWTWHPVEHWEDAGATVQFADESPGFSSVAAEQLFSELKCMGRYVPHGSFTIETSGFLPVYQGQEFSGKFDGWTSAYREAMSMLLNDIKTLFEDLPERDTI